METTFLDLEISSDLFYRFDLPDDIKLNTLSIVVTSNGIQIPRINQHRYKVVDVEKNIIDVYFDPNILDEDIRSTDIRYHIFMTRISTLDLNREEYVKNLIYEGSITIS